MSLVRKISFQWRQLWARVSRKNRLLAGVLGGCLMLTSVVMLSAPKHDPSAVEEKSWPVTSFTTQVENLSPELHLFGRIETPNHATLSAAISAEVTALHVREGQRVTAGELLLSLNPEEEELRLQQRAADLADSEASLISMSRDIQTDKLVLQHMTQLHNLTQSKASRLKTLNSQQLIATEQLENTLQEVARQGIELARQQALVDNGPQRLARAQAAVSRAQASFDNQLLNRQRTEIHAPFSGRITALQVSPGNRVQQGQALVSLYDSNALQVRVAIPSSQVEPLKQALLEGSAITARLNNSPIEARLQQLAGAIGEGKSGVDAIFLVGERGADLELGRAVDLSIYLPQIADVIAVPLQSVYSDRRVYVIEDGRLQSVEILSQGRRLNARGELEVLVSARSLPAGRQVLATNLPKAISGLKVTVINSDPEELAIQSTDGEKVL